MIAPVLASTKKRGIPDRLLQFLGMLDRVTARVEFRNPSPSVRRTDIGRYPSREISPNRVPTFQRRTIRDQVYNVAPKELKMTGVIKHLIILLVHVRKKGGSWMSYAE